MRVIAGKYKGRRLCSFNGNEIRPTSDRAKSALFNIFQFKILNSSFYDGFCGSGAMGIEAISRGALKVVFTDISDDSIKLVNKNLTLIGESACVEKISALDYLVRTSNKFDFIFLDPPYNSSLGVEALKIISIRRLLTRGGVAVYEHKTFDNFDIEGLNRIDSRKYGIVSFDIYEAVE